jgi:replicative DNA helicase
MSAPLPHNIEAEQALLGAVLVNNGAFDVIEGFEADDFFEPLHKRIWGLIEQTIKSGRAATPISLKAHFGDEKIADLTLLQYLIRLAAEAVTVINAADYAKTITETACARRMIGAMHECESVVRAWQPDLSITKEIDHLTGRLDAIAARLAGENAGPSDAYAESLNRTVATAAGEIPFPFPEMGAVLEASGFEATNLYGLLAASGEGKTSLTLGIMRHALRLNHPVLFLSFDQSEVQTVQQMVQQEHSVPMRLQRDHRRDRPRLSRQQEERCWEFSAWLQARPWTFQACDGTETGTRLAAIIKRWRKRLGKNAKTPLVVVDHVSAVMPEDKRAHEGAQIQSVTRPLKNVARATESAIIILYQRNTKSGDRANPAPILNDVNGGQPAMRDLDALLTLYRPWRFMGKIDQSELTGKALADFMRAFSIRDGNDRRIYTESDAILACLKNRFGRDDVSRPIEFIGERTLFRSLHQAQIQERFAV